MSRDITIAPQRCRGSPWPFTNSSRPTHTAPIAASIGREAVVVVEASGPCRTRQLFATRDFACARNSRRSLQGNSLTIPINPKRRLL
jgi:hypothetical protein